MVAAIILSALLLSCSNRYSEIDPAEISSDGSMMRANLRRTGVFDGEAPRQAKKLLWMLEVKEGGLSEAVYSNGMIYFGSSDRVYSLDATTGEEKFRLETGAAGMPAVANELLFFTTLDNSLHAYDSVNGDEVWLSKIGSISMGSPAIDQGVVYVGSQNGLYAIDAKSGEQKWKFDALMVGPPAVFGGMVYFGSERGLFAIDAKNGKQRWVFTPGGAASAPVIENGKVFFTSDIDSSLHCVSTSTGKELWKTNIGAVLLGWASPAVYKDMVIISAMEGMIAMDGNSGEIKWVIKNSGDSFSLPSVAGGVLLFTRKSGGLIAAEVLDGNLIWQHKNNDPNKKTSYAFDAPISADSMIICNEGNQIYALQDPEI